MKKKSILIGIVTSIVLLMSHAWAGPQINPGKWEITTKTEMAGMPAQSMTHTQCVTNDDMVPMSEDANQECRVTDITINGNTVSWKITCGGQGSGGGMEGTGQVTYEGDSMHGTMSMTIKPYGTQVKNTLSGRRIGNCNATKAGTGTSGKTSSATSHSGDKVGEVTANDDKDAGQAANDKAMQNVIGEVREGVKGVKGFVKDLFN